MKKLIRGENDLLTLYPDLSEEWDYSRNNEKKPSDFLPGSHKSVWWVCSKQHAFAMGIRDRVNGKPCPYCSNYKVLAGFNDLVTMCPDVAKEWNYEKNGDLDPTQVKYSANLKVWWKCREGHEWEAFVFNRSKGHGCPYCCNFTSLSGYNDLSTTHSDLVREWNYERNKGMEPSSFLAGSHKKVWWKCSKGHEWKAEIKSRSSGQKCPYCSNKKVLSGYNDLYTYCINNCRDDLINEFDAEKNDFKLSDVTYGSDKLIWWKCPKGHSYQATGHRRIRTGSGCGVCSHNILMKGVNDLLTTHPEIAKEWDYSKNAETPDEVMAGSNIKKYWFTCSKGHSYKTALLNRMHGTDCPICSMEKHTSFPEKAVFYYINKFVENAKENYRNPILGRKEIDIFIPRFCVGIEYDGAAWHKDYQRDLEKDNVCAENGIKIIRLRENGCVDYNSDSIKIYIPPYNMEELNKAIKSIFEYLNASFHVDIDSDIDVDRDRIKILERINLSEKENSIASVCPEILKYWDYDKNGKITPEQITHASMKKIHLKCGIGHEWESVVSNFASRPRCPYCSGRKVWPGFNDLFTTNPELIPFWSKNNTIDPTMIKNGCNSKALWVCPNCGGEYDMKVSDKVKTPGCPYCSGHRVLKSFNDLATFFPSIANEWDRDKNLPLTPELVTKGSNKKVWWKCSVCQYEWEMRVYDRSILNRGCPLCKRSTYNPNAKAVIQLTLDGVKVAEYSSIAEATRQTGVRNIYKACRNPQKLVGGYFWKYKD